MNCDPAVLAKLDELMEAIRGFDDPRRAGDQWKQVFKLLQQTDLPKPRVTHVVGMRDVTGAAALIDQLRAPAGPGGEAPAAGDGGEPPDPETCRRAIKAFKKRVSLTMLDEESKLGHSPLTKGVDSRTSHAIAPPTEFPAEVWRELVRQGRLKYIGHGLYELVKEDHD
ncbi:MAG: hypothetical protein ABFD92_12250 [Planctomycetaceae bacterium]|nr:hypothetical protein [Planctomycetaceae bacterium]